MLTDVKKKQQNTRVHTTDSPPPPLAPPIIVNKSSNKIEIATSILHYQTGFTAKANKKLLLVGAALPVPASPASHAWPHAKAAALSPSSTSLKCRHPAWPRSVFAVRTFYVVLKSSASFIWLKGWNHCLGLFVIFCLSFPLPHPQPHPPVWSHADYLQYFRAQQQTVF